MANSKQKPVPEKAKRSPGKSKFSIPRKEAPPVDGSYLDRLFADYQKQTQVIEALSDNVQAQPVESSQQSPIVEQSEPEVSVFPIPFTTVTLPIETSEESLSIDPVPSPHKETVVETGEHSAIVPTEAPAISVLKDSLVGSEEKSASTSPVISTNHILLLEKWKKKHRLGKGELKVLRVMVGMCREAGGDSCYIKISQLMSDSELKERQTQQVLRNLSELGLIEKIADYSNANRIGTQYRVLLNDN